MNTCDCYTRIEIKGERAIEDAEGRFGFVKHARESWDNLYRCKVCAQYWEVTYPGAGDVCCVDVLVQKISEAGADEKYGIS